MVLTDKQYKGLKITIDRFKNHEKFTVISGYAGTGKSTLVKYIVESLNVDEEQIVYACYTGKACNVLVKKGLKNVSTLHKLLYFHKPLPDGTFLRFPVPSLDPYKVVIIDECSMLPLEMFKQLLTYNIYIIFLGDPFQLPPINKNEDNHLLDSPHIFLDEIMRQEKESEIIRVSMDIRNNKPLSLFHGNEVKIIKKTDLNTGMLKWADQILCAKNKTRNQINLQMKEVLNKNPKVLEEGDKVICLSNYWDILDSAGNPLVNGTIGYVSDILESLFIVPYIIKPEQKIMRLISNITTEIDTSFRQLSMDKKLILEGAQSLTPEQQWKLMKKRVPPLLEFAYGYAITYWKAQGSQWKKVLVIEENFPFDKKEHQRALYTALTRAEEKCIIAMN